MQIIEVRNDILKMAYSPQQNGILLSDFLLVSEGTKSVLAQIINIESSQEEDINIATLKCCLSVDETGRINTYLGFIPSTSAEIASVTQEQVIAMLSTQNIPVVWGELAQHDNINFKTDKEILTNRLLVLMDDYENYNVIVNNLAYSNKKLGQKTVVVDFDGTIKLENAFYIKVGEDLKFPLSFNTLNYMYENDIKSESLATQAVVQDIIIELQNYIKTLESGFLPFSTVKDVVYAQYEENKIPELMLFKNKFVKYAQDEFLAETQDDFNSLNELINENELVVIDATELDTTWHKYLLNYLAKEIKTACSFITKLENDNSDKRTILELYRNKIISPIITANYSHKCTTVLKSIAKNMILFPPINQINDFATYNSFMQKLNRDEYVICGEDTLYLTFILRLTYLDSNMAPDYIEREIQQDVDKLYGSTIQPQANILKDEPKSTIVPQAQQPVQAEDETLTDDDLDFLDDLDDLDKIDSIDDTENIEITEEPIEKTPIANQQIENILESEYDEEIAEIEETEEVEAGGLVIEAEPTDETIDEEATEEPQSPQPMAQNTVSDIPAESEIKKSKPKAERPLPETQPIPIYSVPELEVEAPAEFSEGNFVFHEKYGKGVIEKIMNYGNKTLCSIQFEDVGRRLLDPNLAGLKQV